MGRPESIPQMATDLHHYGHLRSGHSDQHYYSSSMIHRVAIKTNENSTIQSISALVLEVPDQQISPDESGLGFLSLFHHRKAVYAG
jgi:hypothetical protein